MILLFSIVILPPKVAPTTKPKLFPVTWWEIPWWVPPGLPLLVS
jgi:hypothetical protein